MAIQLAKNYIDLLDEVYRNSACSADLIADPALVRAGSTAKSVLYPQISLNGLGDYDRNSGYTDGAVDVAVTGIATGIAMVLGVSESEISTVSGAVLALVSAVTYIVAEGKIDAERVKNAVESTQDAVDVIENETKVGV